MSVRRVCGFVSKETLPVGEPERPHVSDDEGCTVELHLRARIENGELEEKQILCPGCCGEAEKFVACSLGGVPCAFLACCQCGKHLAEFATDAEMERHLEQIWRGAQEYLLYPPPGTQKKTVLSSSQICVVQSPILARNSSPNANILSETLSQYTTLARAQNSPRRDCTNRRVSGGSGRSVRTRTP